MCKLSNLIIHDNVFLGLSELGAIATMQRKGHNNHDSCGKVVGDMELKIVDINTNKALGPNEKGEIHLRKPHMMKHYFNNPKATEEAIDKDGNNNNNK